MLFLVGGSGKFDVLSADGRRAIAGGRLPNSFGYYAYVSKLRDRLLLQLGRQAVAEGARPNGLGGGYLIEIEAEDK